MKIKNAYEQLMNIKKPTLIVVLGEDKKTSEPKVFRDRLRILYPDGRCEWVNINSNECEFEPSCFTTDTNSLARTVSGMIEYDLKFEQIIVGLTQL